MASLRSPLRLVVVVCGEFRTCGWTLHDLIFKWVDFYYKLISPALPHVIALISLDVFCLVVTILFLISLSVPWRRAGRHAWTAWDPSVRDAAEAGPGLGDHGSVPLPL